MLSEFWSDVRYRLRAILRRDALERDLDDELRFHIEREAEKDIAQGIAPDEAFRRARMAFGGLDQIKEQSRDIGRVKLIADAWKDLRHSARGLRRSPGFTVATVLTLALGIGASSSIFSVANGVLFRSLPYENPDQLIRIYKTNRTGDRSNAVSPPNFMSIREENRSFTEVAIADNEDLTLTGRGEPRWVEGAEVSAGFFEVMGATPIVGRTFLEGENLPGADGVVVISHSLWQEVTGGRADIVGQTMMLHARSRVVIGVMPAGFDFPFGSDVWIPLEYDENYSGASAVGRRGFAAEYTVARLRDDATPNAARSDLAELANRLERRFPEGNRDTGFTISLLRDSLIGSARTPLLLLLASVGLLLLIACANVAGLFLARAAGRQDELAVRVAIGAGRGRLVRQLMTESLLVGMLGGSLGLLLTAWATRLVVATTPDLPRIDEIHIDGAVYSFGLGVTLLAVMLTGLVPAWQAARTAAASRLREGGRSAVRSGARMRAGLVTAEIALAVVLLAAAGLLLKSFARLASADPGFRTEGAVAFMVRLPDSYDTDDAVEVSYYDELLQRLRALPGVEGTGAVHRLPMAWNGFGTRLTRIDGAEPPEPGQEPSVISRSVTPGYFEAMRIPILGGRGIAESDRVGAPPVVVINETAAQRFFQGEDPVGRRIALSVGEDDLLRTVVGIVGDVVDQRFADVQEPEIFLPFAQAPWSSYMSIVVRGRGDPLALVPAIRRAVLQVDPNLPARDFRSLQRVVEDSVAGERFLSSLLGLFASAALLLASIGVFGLLSFTVAERTREIGVRVALGATRREIMTMVLRDALRLAGVGLAIGVTGALLLGRLLDGLLYEVSPTDPTAIGTMAALLLLVALLASWLPARQAAQVDPVTALRQG